jgi:hypothetical protein
MTVKKQIASHHPEIPQNRMKTEPKTDLDAITMIASFKHKAHQSIGIAARRIEYWHTILAILLMLCASSTAYSKGSILREYWTNVTGGAVADIPLNTSPSGSDVLTSFEGPTNWADNYGTRIRGYLVPPVTGSYTFWIATDDNGELWLSTDETPAHKQKIASVTGWAGSRDWNKFASQKSVFINLVAGTFYYIEALQKESGGGDNLAVGWAKPGQSTSAPSEVIPGSALAQAAPFNVLTYGAKADGTTDDAPAINAAIAACVASGSGNEVYIPAGNYRLGTSPGRGAYVIITNGQGITVRGDAGTVLIADDPSYNNVDLENCTNVTLRMLTLDRKNRCFTQGTILAVDDASRSCDVVIDSGYDEPDAPLLQNLTTIRPFTYPETETYQQDRDLPVIKTRTRTGPLAWRFALNDGTPAPNLVGKKFILWDDVKSGHGIVGSNNQDCLVEDVSYWARGANAGLYLVGSKGTMTFRRLRIETPPNSADMLASSGGGQIVNTRGSLVFDNCDVSKVDDDGTDILSNYVRVLSQINSRTLQLQGNEGFLAGDTMAIMDWVLKQETVKANIVSVTSGTGGTCTVTLDKDVVVLHTGPGDNNNKGNDGIDRVVDYSLACTSVTYTNCRMQSLRARALNLKSQNTLIENCTFHGCEMPAVFAGAEIWWGEAPAVSNLTIRNCRFVNCNQNNIVVQYDGVGSDCNARDNKNILIEGNTFVNYAAHGTRTGGAVLVRYGNGVTVQNNDFSQRSPNAPLDVPRLVIEKCDNVVTGTNTGLVALTGNVLREYWTNVTGVAVTDIPLNTSPSGSDVLTSFEGPTNWADNYGTRIRGYLVPPVTGSYTFWIATDDNGELWLSTDATPDHKQMIASVTGDTGVRQWGSYASQKSVSINLVAGKFYYIEALQKEAGGRDNLAVGWAKPGESTTTASEVIPGSVLTQYVRSGSILCDYWTNIGGTSVSNIPLTTTPTFTEVFSSLEGPTNWADNYGSQFAGYLVPPITGDYTFWLASDDNGELWLSTNDSATNKQMIASVPGDTGVRQWGSYASQKSVSINLVAGRYYYLQVLQKEAGGGGNVAVGWAKPGEATAAPSEVIPGRVLAQNPRSGYVLYEYWTGVGGTAVADIPLNYLPTYTDLLTSMEAPTDWAGGYGARIRGCLVAPTTGAYTFWIASDDNSELWLSTDATSGRKQKIASVPYATGVRQWGGFASQKSVSINLVAGKSYYIEALHKEGGGSDNLAVGWAKPGQSTAAPSEVIPGSVLTLPQYVCSGSIPYDSGTFDGNGDGLPDGWQIQYFGPGFATNPQAAPTANPSGDHTCNLLKFAYGMDPTVCSLAGLPTSKLQTVDGKSYLCITFHQRPDGSSAVTYTVQTSADLSTWSSVGVGQIGTATPDANGITETVTYKDSVPSTSATRRFIRVKVN